MEASFCGSDGGRYVVRLQQHDALLEIEERRRFAGAARRRCRRLWKRAAGRAAEAAVVEVRADAEVICVVDLHQDVAGLRGDLKEPLLEVVVFVVVIVGARAT